MTVPSIPSSFDLKGNQRTAATRLDTHLAVTAGAGSGKTRALVARYLNFVEQGAPVRSLVAITFTEKAAREMRSRIRREIERWLAEEEGGQGSDSPLPSSAVSTTGEGPGVRWQTAFIELDSARISTIHALCADLLRLYPAEAGVDPRFTVLEEGLAATLQARAIETSLAWAGNDAEAARLFAAFKESELRGVLSRLLTARLDAGPALALPDPLARWAEAMQRWLSEWLAAPQWVHALATLTEYASPNGDDKLETARQAVLACWGETQTALAAGSWGAAFDALRELRSAISTGGQKANWDASALEAARGAMKSLREYYDETLKPLVGTTTAVITCRWALDRQAAALLPPLRRVFGRTLADYQSLKNERRALDFDDLESLAARLLTIGNQQSAISNLRAVLVDEFQDTNNRQRQIVYALTGFGDQDANSANLFIVGDPKQSIYRFRGADVTVFRRIQSDVEQGGGEVIDLDLTFRAHPSLLDLTNRLLAPLMGEADDPARPYRVPFTPLTPHRQTPRDGVRQPFVAFRIGVGDSAETGREAAATALAARLRELREQEGFAWEDIALLFRASTAFPVYEDALEVAGIPFVTVAGKGFYDRPEIRDLLNALAAIADPTDDLALAGLLRSPAFGLTDADLYHLRYPAPRGGDEPQPLWQSLGLPSPVGALPKGDGAGARAIITTLHRLAGRLPIAELLKQFLDRTHYRAVLRAADGGQRRSRNVDKLLADAHRSRLVYVGDFLEYVQSLRDVGAREGEAPPEVGGAVQLMTVHKAKGLEFPLVVIADAGHDPRGGSAATVGLDPDLGVVLKLAEDKSRPFAWQLGALADTDREDAEDLRLLYVAATRAQDKIIISGHAKISAAKNDPGRLLLSGWLGRLGSVVGLDAVRLPERELTAPVALQLPPEWAASVAATLHPPAETPSVSKTLGVSTLQPEPASPPGPLAMTTFSPLPSEKFPTGRPERGPGVRAGGEVWRVVPSGRKPPAWVVGQLVHAALRRWAFPDMSASSTALREAAQWDRASFDDRLRPTALEAGLTDQAAIRAALREARRLLERFRAHPLFAEMDLATERYHEVPYAVGDDVGVIDMLYRGKAGEVWTVADFKTDELRSEAEMWTAIREGQYDVQLERYAEAVAAQLGSRPHTLLVFLNLNGTVHVTLQAD